jgi:hypothetical protein
VTAGPFLCARCGAVQTLPSDLEALVAQCPFCGQENPLPADAVALRNEQARREAAREAEELAAATQEQTQKRATRTVIIIVALVIALPVLGSLLVILLVSRVAATTPPPPSPPAPLASSPVAVPPPKPAPDPHSTGAEQVKARLDNLRALGCTTVIMPPSEAVGVRSLQADLVANGRCVRVLAINGIANNTLTLTMKTPLGEDIAAPPASAEVELSYCPKTPGPHPTTITPAIEDDPYTVAAVECPASVGAKPKP